MVKGKPSSRQPPKKSKRSRGKTADQKGKQSRGKEAAQSTDTEEIAWAFSAVDKEGDWGWRSQAARVWWKEILPKLQGFESMTWIKIMQVSGGKAKGRGTNNHFISVEDLTRKAQNRLVEINQGDVDQLFSLRLGGTKRIYGIRDRRVLKLLWYDPNHEVCPSSKFRT